MSQLDPHRRRLTLVAMCLGQAMILLDNTIVNVALPSIQRELGVTPGNLEWVVNAYVLALAALILVGGTLGDRYGRRRVFVSGLAVFTLGSALCALATDDPQLVAFRALQGVGAALMAPLALSILVDAFPEEDRRTQAIGIWAAAAGLGFSAGPVVGGVLIELFDWSAIFWVNVPLGIVTATLTLAAVRDSRDPAARRLDPLGAVLASAGLFLLTFALVGTNQHPWLSARTLALLAAAVALLAAFVAWQRRAPAPMLELGLFRNRRFLAGSIVYGTAYLALAGIFFFMTLYFQNVRGWSALETGLSWIPLNLPFLAVTPFAGRIVHALGSARTAGTGVLLAALGTATLAALSVDAAYAQAVVGYLLVGLGFGLVVPSVSSAAMSAVPPAHSGVGSGVLNASRQVGAAVGLAVLGSISVAAVARTWTGPEALVQRVAGGELDGAAAHDAFVAGLHAGLWTAAAALLAVVAVAFLGLRSAPALAHGDVGLHPAGGVPGLQADEQVAARPPQADPEGEGLAGGDLR
jgi:MFS transporter, DHA2 family, methylenomycin A resistance protein